MLYVLSEVVIFSPFSFLLAMSRCAAAARMGQEPLPSMAPIMYVEGCRDTKPPGALDIPVPIVTTPSEPYSLPASSRSALDLPSLHSTASPDHQAMEELSLNSLEVGYQATTATCDASTQTELGDAEPGGPVFSATLGSPPDRLPSGARGWGNHLAFLRSMVPGSPPDIAETTPEDYEDILRWSLCLSDSDEEAWGLFHCLHVH